MSTRISAGVDDCSCFLTFITMYSMIPIDCKITNFPYSCWLCKRQRHCTKAAPWKLYYSITHILNCSFKVNSSLIWKNNNYFQTFVQYLITVVVPDQSIKVITWLCYGCISKE